MLSLTASACANCCMLGRFCCHCCNTCCTCAGSVLLNGLEGCSNVNADNNSDPRILFTGLLLVRLLVVKLFVGLLVAGLLAGALAKALACVLLAILACEFAFTPGRKIGRASCRERADV